jgi:hypothetical protein
MADNSHDNSPPLEDEMSSTSNLTNSPATPTSSMETLLASFLELQKAQHQSTEKLLTEIQQSNLRLENAINQLSDKLTSSPRAASPTLSPTSHAATLTVQSSFGDTFSSSQLLQPPDTLDFRQEFFGGLVLGFLRLQELVLRFQESVGGFLVGYLKFEESIQERVFPYKTWVWQQN